MPSRSNSTARKRSRSLAILVAVVFAGFCLVNVHLVARLDSSIGAASNDRILPLPSSSAASRRDVTGAGGHNSTNKERVIEYFRQAGVELDDESIKKLPTWEQVESIIGDEPVILGLERCSDFRSNVPPLRRMLGSAGMFNSGTNLVTRLMKENCVIPERFKKYGPNARKEQYGIRWQCPWGKHTPVSFKDAHTVPVNNENVTKDDCLPIVTIRNPYDWMKSMCKHPYTARWEMREAGRVGDICPHLVRTAGGASGKKAHVPLKVKLAEQWLSHDSLAGLWNDWYAEYYRDFTFPFLMVRMEDLVLRQRETTKIICECAGGTVPPSHTFKYIIDSAKQGPGHGKKEERTGMVDAWMKYGKPQDVKGGFSDSDWEASLELLSRDLMEKMGYRYPPSE